MVEGGSSKLGIMGKWIPTREHVLAGGKLAANWCKITNPGVRGATIRMNIAQSLALYVYSSATTNIDMEGTIEML